MLIWKCLKCGSIQVSNPYLHHQMDYCKCGESAVDLETYSCRYIGPVESLEECNYFDELVLGLSEQKVITLIKMDSVYLDFTDVMLIRELESQIIEDYISKYSLSKELKDWMNCFYGWSSSEKNKDSRLILEFTELKKIIKKIEKLESGKNN